MKVADNKIENQIRKNQIIIYEGDDGKSRVEVRFEGETAWLTQAQLVELFASSKANISEHIKNIFEEGELQENSVVRNFRTTATDGKSKTRIPQISSKNAVTSRGSIFGKYQGSGEKGEEESEVNYEYIKNNY